jgi:hypothetical protein
MFFLFVIWHVFSNIAVVRSFFFPFRFYGAINIKLGAAHLGVKAEKQVCDFDTLLVLSLCTTTCGTSREAEIPDRPR